MKYLVIDSSGLYVELANGLADGGKNKVWYYTGYEPELKWEFYAPGLGFEFLEKVLYPADYYSKCDCIVNFDCTKQDDIDFLRKLYGDKKSVFGSGLGARLELDRFAFKKILRDVGLKVNLTEKIKGTTKLKEYLKENKNKYVKVNIWRGNIESFPASNYDAVELIIDEIEHKLGFYKEEFIFLCEDMVDAPLELGFDGFFSNGDYLKPYLVGIEYHKSTYACRVTDKMPFLLGDTLNAIKPVLSKLDYRGAISTEEMCIDKKQHLFLDLCARCLNPVSVLYPQFIKNWPAVVEQVGRNNNIRLDIKQKYLFAQPLNCPSAKDVHVRIEIDKKDRDNIKFVSAAEYNGKYFAIKGCDKLAVLVSASDSIDEGINLLKKYGEKINASGLEKDILHGIDHIKEKINEAHKLGVDF